MTDRTPKNRTTPPADWQARFLVSLADYGNVMAACRKAKVSRNTAYEARKANAEFAAAWDEAKALGTDALEDEARRRAYNGVRKPVHQGGKLVGYVQDYSDTLLIFLLKAHDPKFRETTRNVNINLTPDEAAKLTDDELEQLGKERGLW